MFDQATNQTYLDIRKNFRLNPEDEKATKDQYQKGFSEPAFVTEIDGSVLEQVKTQFYDSIANTRKLEPHSKVNLIPV